MFRLYPAQAPLVPVTWAPGLGWVPAQPSAEFVLGLGDFPSPTLDAIKNIARTFPRCFSSRSLLPAIDRSIAFAQSITTEGLSRFGGTASPESVKRSIDEAVGKLQYWRGRLATEPVTVYCSDMTKRVLEQPGISAQPKVSSEDYRLVEQAIVGPYQILYGIEGARQVVETAARGLYADLLLGFYNPLTGAFAIPTWAKVAGAGALVLLGLKLVRTVF